MLAAEPSESEEDEPHDSANEAVAMKTEARYPPPANQRTLLSSTARTSDQRQDQRTRTYAFSLRDDKVSAKKPPGRCFVCGSENHWKRECNLPAYEAACKAGCLKNAHVHAIDKEYEEEQQEYFLELAEAEMTTQNSQAF